MGRKVILLLMCVATVVACMKYGPVEEEGFDAGGKGLFVVNEGNFMYGNASLSYYDPETGRVENEVFARANGQKLGDVAQSMTLHGGLAWVVVNNSGVVFAIDPDTFKEVGRVTGFTSPRHIHFVSDTKAYVTQIWDSRICVINPKTYTITGYVETGMDPQSGSTEQMVAHGGFVYTNCWSYQNRLLKIDTQTDTVAGELVVGIQPASLVIDSAGKLWTLTDGGYEGSPYGHEAPALHRIDAGTFTIEKVFRFGAGDRPSELCIDGDGDEIYWIDRSSVWRMGIGDERMPTRPFIEEGGTIFYGLSVNPSGGEVYVADAIDHVQNGVVARYSPEGELIDTFKAGVSPGAFCWK